MIHHLAQLNIARMVAPLDDPIMADFVANLERINELADDTPGFVWRLVGDGSDGADATSLRPFEDDVIVNMSVWENIEALYQYAYYSPHVEIFRRRAEWFHSREVAMVALWWVPAGHIPTVDEAKERLMHLREHGATPYAFTFKQQFSVEERMAYQVRV
jgi:Domain of unknown function (DUF3291)